MKTTRGKIVIKSRDTHAELTVDAHISGGFAIHRPMISDFGVGETGWVITHVESGLTVLGYQIDTFKNARLVMRRLLDSAIDWSRDADYLRDMSSTFLPLASKAYQSLWDDEAAS